MKICEIFLNLRIFLNQKSEVLKVNSWNFQIWLLSDFSKLQNTKFPNPTLNAPTVHTYCRLKRKYLIHSSFRIFPVSLSRFSRISYMYLLPPSPLKYSTLSLQLPSSHTEHSLVCLHVVRYVLYMLFQSFLRIHITILSIMFRWYGSLTFTRVSICRIYRYDIWYRCFASQGLVFYLYFSFQSMWKWSFVESFFWRKKKKSRI